VVSCKDFLDELSSYLDDELSPDYRRELTAHVEGCSTCQVLLDSTGKTIRIVTETRSFDMGDRLSERLVQRILERLRGHERSGT